LVLDETQASRRRPLISAALFVRAHHLQEIAMSKLRLAVLLPACAVGLALPTWAIGLPSEQNPNSATAPQTEQARTDSISKEQDSSKATESTKSGGTSVKGKNSKGHGPTAVMDRAAPVEKSPSVQGSSGKHPPTGRMDQATPDQKSPGANSSSPQASGSDSQSAATK